MIERVANAIRRWAETSSRGHQNALIARDTSPAPLSGVLPRAGILSTVRPGSQTPRVFLHLPSLSADSFYAGIRTAVYAGADIACETGLQLTLVVDGRFDPVRARRIVERSIYQRTGRATEFDLVPLASCVDMRTHPKDVWIVTHWTTAARLWEASHVGAVDPARVIYLIQDYEPDFVPASSDRALVQATYGAGFVPLVNSTPVADRLRSDGMRVDSSLVFAPEMELNELQRAAETRPLEMPSTVRVLIYGRPSKPRNMFATAVAAAREAVRINKESTLPVIFVSAGEKHHDAWLPQGGRIKSLGNIGWSGYYTELARAHVLVSLQASTHPSHPPLEGAMAGAAVVTNEVGGTRCLLHSRIHAAPGDPINLGRTLAQTINDAPSVNDRSFLPFDDEQLGAPLRDGALEALGRVR